MAEWLVAIRIDSIQDLFRAINVVLGLAIFAGLMFDRYAPWRISTSTQRLLTFAVAGSFLWQSYTNVEVVWLLPQVPPPVEDYGARIYGLTVWYLLVVVAIIERRRRRATWAKHAELVEAAAVIERRSRPNGGTQPC